MSGGIKDATTRQTESVEIPSFGQIFCEFTATSGPKSSAFEILN